MKSAGRDRESTLFLTEQGVKAVRQIKLDLKSWRMNRLGIPQERIAMRLGETRDVIRNHLGEMLILTKSPNTDLSRGSTIPQVADRRHCLRNGLMLEQ